MSILIQLLTCQRRLQRKRCINLMGGIEEQQTTLDSPKEFGVEGIGR